MRGEGKDRQTGKREERDGTDWYAISETVVSKLFPDFVELKLFKVMVVDASEDLRVAYLWTRFGGGVDPSPSTPPHENAHE